MKSKLRGLKIFGIIIASIIVFFVVVNILPHKKVTSKNIWRAPENKKTLISAHRGGAFMFPENTKMIFDYSIKETDFCDIIEIDVRSTKDGELVIIHDDNLNRVALPSGKPTVKVSLFTYEELCNYNLGYNFVTRDGQTPYKNLLIEEAALSGLTIMKLTEFFDEYKNARDFKLFLEIKESDPGLAIADLDKVMKLLSEPEYAWYTDRTLIISFTDKMMTYLYQTYPKQNRSPLGYNIAPFIGFEKLGLSLFYNPQYEVFSSTMVQKIGPLKFNIASKALINKAHAKNMAVCYWTVNDKADMEKLIDIGTDVITTNAPDVLYSVLQDRGLR